MSNYKLAGDWSVKLEPLIINKRGPNGLSYEHDTLQDRVIVTQGEVSRQVGWYFREMNIVLPLSGAVHPDDMETIQAKVQTLLDIPPEKWNKAAEMLESGRNANEQENDDEPDEDDDE